MSSVSREGDRFVLDLTDADDTSNWHGINLQFLTPLLLGLLLPLVAINYLDPTALRYWKLPIFLFLVTMFFVCTGLFAYTAHFPGKIHTLVLHRDERMLELVWRNMISTTTQLVPFSDISALRVRNDYDRDGYAVPLAELVLRSKSPIVLPEGTTAQQLVPLRAAIGLA